MARLSSIVLALVAASVTGFVVPSNRAFVPSTRSAPSKTAMEAAPTLVIYWSIKTAFDGAAYALGMTDELKGTGVWSGIEMKRDTSDEEDKEKPPVESEN